MKVFIRLIFLRFDIFKPEAEQAYCPVGIFYRPEGASYFSNIVINHGSEMPGLPILLINLESAFTYGRRKNLRAIAIAPLYAGGREFQLGEVQQIEVPDGLPKLDKHLFVTYIASQERFKPVVEGQKLYRRVMGARRVVASGRPVIHV